MKLMGISYRRLLLAAFAKRLTAARVSKVEVLHAKKRAPMCMQEESGTPRFQCH